MEWPVGSSRILDARSLSYQSNIFVLVVILIKLPLFLLYITDHLASYLDMLGQLENDFWRYCVGTSYWWAWTSCGGYL